MTRWRNQHLEPGDSATYPTGPRRAAQEQGKWQWPGYRRKLADISIT